MAADLPTNLTAAQAFPEGDPRNAQYGENLAALLKQREGRKAELIQGRGENQASAAYRESQLTQNEPETYRANQHRANAGGIASSGINAQRRGGIARDYANKRFGVQQGLTSAENRINRQNKQAEETYEGGASRAATTALEAGRRNLEEHPPESPYAKAANKGGIRSLEGEAGAGGVVPYTETLPGGGFVSVGRTRAQRLAAMKRAVG